MHSCFHFFGGPGRVIFAFNGKIPSVFCVDPEIMIWLTGKRMLPLCESCKVLLVEGISKDKYADMTWIRTWVKYLQTITVARANLPCCNGCMAACIQAVLAMKQTGHESCSAYDQMDSSRNLCIVPVWLPLWYSLGAKDASISEHRQGRLKLDPASGLGKEYTSHELILCVGSITRSNCTQAQAHESCRRHVTDSSWYEGSDPWICLVVACRH